MLVFFVLGLSAHFPFVFATSRFAFQKLLSFVLA